MLRIVFVCRTLETYCLFLSCASFPLVSLTCYGPKVFFWLCTFFANAFLVLITDCLCSHLLIAYRGAPNMVFIIPSNLQRGLWPWHSSILCPLLFFIIFCCLFIFVYNINSTMLSSQDFLCSFVYPIIWLINARETVFSDIFSMETYLPKQLTCFLSLRYCIICFILVLLSWCVTV